MAIGDLNSDGFLDLAVANFNADTVSVLQGDGTGGFAVPLDFAVGHHPRSLAIGELNGDDRLDLIVANDSSNTVRCC